MYHGKDEDDDYYKMYLYSTSEFRGYLDLFLCLCRYKFRLCWICYECVQFQNEKLAVVYSGEAWTDFPLNISVKHYAT